MPALPDRLFFLYADETATNYEDVFTTLKAAVKWAVKKKMTDWIVTFNHEHDTRSFLRHSDANVETI